MRTCQRFVMPWVAAAFVVATLPAAASRASAGSSFGAGGGANFSAGPGDQSTSVGYGYASGIAGYSSLALGALGFDDHDAGAGWGPLAAAAIGFGPSWRIRAWATRYLGESGFRADRYRGGPEWTLPGDRTIGVFYGYLDSDLGGIARSVSAEVGLPIRSGWNATLSGGMTRTADALDSAHGTVGVGFEPRSDVELTAEVGLSQRGEFVLSPASRGRGSGGLLGDPLGLGTGSDPGAGAGNTRLVTGTEPTFGLGIRFTLP